MLHGTYTCPQKSTREVETMKTQVERSWVRSHGDGKVFQTQNLGQKHLLILRCIISMQPFVRETFDCNGTSEAITLKVLQFCTYKSVYTSAAKIKYARLCQLKYFVLKSENKHGNFDFDNTCGYK